PGAGEVVVRVRAVGVNPVDTYIRAGTYPLQQPFPYTPGLDAAGVVEAIGQGVKHRRVGERVYVAGSLSGTYAEQALCEESQVQPLPEEISFAQGAALGVPYGTAWYALFLRARALPGEFLLVHGASGGVGIAAVQMARSAGLRVIGTAGTPEGRELVENQGAHHVLDHSRPDYLDRLDELTCGHGVDVVLEMLANVNLQRDLGILAMHGRVVVIGCRGEVQIDPRAVMGRNADILGMLLFNAQEGERRAMHAAIVAGLESGTLNPVVGREWPLVEAPAAHEAIMAPGAYGKIVLLT
ncbi:MAG: NADPH:quinone reductase, partial [Desulfuromonadales bacterium]|nr:NADPH:quinone reductase [Desulfuromonadales bacterium]